MYAECASLPPFSCLIVCFVTAVTFASSHLYHLPLCFIQPT